MKVYGKAYLEGRSEAWEHTRFLFDDGLTLEAVRLFSQERMDWANTHLRLATEDGDETLVEFLDGYVDCMGQRLAAVSEHFFGLAGWTRGDG